MINLGQYGFIRIGSVSPEMRVADVEFNTEKIIEAMKSAKTENCHFLLFPELCITGYTCGDLFYQTALLESVFPAIRKLCEASLKYDVSIVVGAPVKADSRLFNAAILISDNEIKGIIPKTFLCNTNEYYEERWFSSEFDRQSDEIEIGEKEIPFGTDLLFKVSGTDAVIGIEICEDLWSLFPPSLYQASAGANLILNLSASDEYLGKSKYRDDLVRSQSARCLASYVYSSSGPGESSTDLVFSGKCLISENGHILNESGKYNFEIIYADIDIQKLETERLKNNSFASSGSDQIFRIIELNIPNTEDIRILRPISKMPFVPSNKNEKADNCKEIFEIQATGLAKRIKHIGLKNVVIGLSGGLDSTLALLVCLKAFKKCNLDLSGINCISMPGFGTTSRTKTNAQKLAESMGVSFRNIPIKKAVEQHFKDINHEPDNYNIVFENSQARERTQILMDIANQQSGIVIGTGDLSELALGWSTYNGDHISMYGVNSGVPKTLVRYIIEWCAEEEFSGDISNILQDICNTPISPELLPPDSKGNIIQKTEESVGPYILHDFFLYYFVRWGFPPNKILLLAKIAFDGDFSEAELRKWLKIFIKRFFGQQFKRSCLPDGVKVGTVALSPRGDWRMPSDAINKLWLEMC